MCIHIEGKRRAANDHFVPELHQANFQLLFFFFQT